MASVALNLAIFAAFGWQILLMRRQLDLAREALDSDHVQRRRQATFDFITATINRVSELRARGLPDLRRAEVEAYASDPHGDDSESNRTITDYLNGYESFSTGANIGLYDLEVICRLRAAMIVRTWELYRPWIVARRTIYQMPSLYAELEELAARVKRFLAERHLGAVSIV